MKILIIDDSRMIRMIVANIIASLGFSPLEASSGETAFDVLAQEVNEIGLILLDWNMPDMNGLDFLQKIKDTEAYKHIPVMMLTSEGERINIVKAMKHGAIQYLQKPFTPEDLSAKVLECFGMTDICEEL